MSEYQYFAFQAVDRALDGADREALRAISTRAIITATSFVNTYHWGNFKGDPAVFMDRWFDLHLYLTNWGTRRFMMKVPLEFVDRPAIEAFLLESDDVTLRRSKTNLVIDIQRENDEGGDVYDDDDENDEQSTILSSLASLRADVLAGDLRIFSLVWLRAVQRDVYLPEEPEPLDGLGPLTGALTTFARVLGVDSDLLAAAAERSGAATVAIPPAEMRRFLETLPDRDKTDLLMRLATGDPGARMALQRLAQSRAAEQPAAAAPRRTVGDLRARARAIGVARTRAAAEAKAAAERKQAAAAEQARQARMRALEQRGEHAWREVDDEIARRNAAGYEKATRLLTDLHGLAEMRNKMVAFQHRLAAIRTANAQKARFIERLRAAGL